MRQYEKPPAHWPDELVEADRQAQNLAMYCELMGLTCTIVVFPSDGLAKAQRDAKVTGAGSAPRSVTMLGRVDQAILMLHEKFDQYRVAAQAKEKRN